MSRCCVTSPEAPRPRLLAGPRNGAALPAAPESSRKGSDRMSAAEARIDSAALPQTALYQYGIIHMAYMRSRSLSVTLAPASTWRRSACACTREPPIVFTSQTKKKQGVS
jgi:hypothetical protein